MSQRLLDREQLGHLRHWDNLSRRLPNDWSLMHGKGVGQDDFNAYRFQLATMIYGLALAHRHRLPAAPGLFRPMIQRLIAKLLEPEVWLYWKDRSRGGGVFNAHISLHEEWDPVIRDNATYSAYLHSTALLHDHLFADDQYARPGSLTFRHWSIYWGGEEKRFAYDRHSLNESLYWQLAENGFLGIGCPPNCIYPVFTQPVLLGFRLHDLITGKNQVEHVLAAYERAWSGLGRLDASGHYTTMVLADTREVFPNTVPEPWADAWCGTMMNTWNSEFVHEHYPRQVKDFLVRGPGGTLCVPAPPPQEVGGHQLVSDTCDYGLVAAWASEMGDRETLDGLFAHAERYFSPAWADGGLYYPRNDTPTDAGGNRTEIEPMTGNVLLGYARLNVADGLRSIYQEPWDARHFAEPAIVAVDRNVDISRAEVLDGVLHARLRLREDLPGEGTVTLGRVPARWRLSLNGNAIDEPRDHDGELVVTVPTGGDHDLVLAGEQGLDPLPVT